MCTCACMWCVGIKLLCDYEGIHKLHPFNSQGSSSHLSWMGMQNFLKSSRSVRLDGIVLSVSMAAGRGASGHRGQGGPLIHLFSYTYPHTSIPVSIHLSIHQRTYLLHFRLASSRGLSLAEQSIGNLADVFIYVSIHLSFYLPICVPMYGNFPF